MSNEDALWADFKHKMVRYMMWAFVAGLVLGSLAVIAVAWTWVKLHGGQ